MEAMAIRAHSSRQLGSSVSLPFKRIGPVSSRDVSCARSTSAVFVTPVRMYTDDQHRLVLVNCRPQGMKCAMVASRPDLSISRQSDVEVVAERPKQIGRFAASVKKVSVFPSRPFVKLSLTPPCDVFRNMFPVGNRVKGRMIGRRELEEKLVAPSACLVLFV